MAVRTIYMHRVPELAVTYETKCYTDTLPLYRPSLFCDWCVCACESVSVCVSKLVVTYETKCYTDTLPLYRPCLFCDWCVCACVHVCACV